MQQIARSVTMEGCGALRDCRYLLHDRDTKYTQSFLAQEGSNAVNLEHVLGEIQTDRGNLHVDGSSCDSSNNDHPTALRCRGAGAVHHTNKRHRHLVGAAGHSHSPNGIYGISTVDRDHSGFMLAARITLPHFSVSSAISLPKSAGAPAWMRNPRSSYLALISGRARDALISLLSTSTISARIFLGPAMPTQLSNA